MKCLKFFIADAPKPTEFKELLESISEEYCIEVFTKHRYADDTWLWKLIGLLITDGSLANLTKGSSIISFRGLNKDTAYAVFGTLVKVFGTCKIKLSKQNTQKLKKPYYDVLVNINSVTHAMPRIKKLINL